MPQHPHELVGDQALASAGVVPLEDYPWLTPRDHQVLVDLARFRSLTGEQVSRLRFGHPKLAQRRLRRLRAAGIIERFRPVEAASGVAGAWFYRLAPPGIAAAAGMLGVRPEVLRLATRPTFSSGYLAHRRAVGDVLVWLTEACRRTPGFSLTFCRPHQASPLVRVHHVGFTLDIPSLGLRPDAVVALTREDGKAALFFVESDRATEPITGEHPSSLTRKLNAYTRLYDEGLYQDVGGLLGLRPAGYRVLLTAPSMHRVTTILRLATAQGLAPLVWATTADHLRPTGHLAARIWQMTPEGEGHAIAE